MKTAALKPALRRKRALMAIEQALRTATRQASNSKMDFSYVYILQSEVDRVHFYTGLTDNLKDRLRRHNAGEVPHTAKFKQ